MIYFLNIVLTWKIVEVSEVSVIYIYIYINYMIEMKSPCSNSFWSR